MGVQSTKYYVINSSSSTVCISEASDGGYMCGSLYEIHELNPGDSYIVYSHDGLYLNTKQGYIEWTDIHHNMTVDGSKVQITNNSDGKCVTFISI